MAGYAKLFSSILASTVWDTPPAITKVWITMMAMADRDGLIEASIPGLAHIARVSRQDCDEALRIFLGPDPDSRTPDNEGRRIEAVPGGWRLLNHAEYRDRMSPEDIREKAAIRQQRHRGKTNDGTTYVYFARDSVTHLIKIGYSSNPEARVETGNLKDAGARGPCTILCKVPGDKDEEKRLQHLFGKQWVRGEWFRNEGELRSFLSREDCDKDDCHGGNDIQKQSQKQDPDLSLSPSSSRSSNPDQTGARSNPGAGLSPFSPPRPARTVIPVGVKTEAFKAVFERYPRKDGEMKAAVVFADLASSTPGGEAALAKEILAAFDRGMLKRHPYAGPNATRPMLETILAEHRWRDPPSAPDNEPTPVRVSSFREL